MMIVEGKWYISRVHSDSALGRGAGTTCKKWEEGSLPQHANIIVGDSRCNTACLVLARLLFERPIIDRTVPEHSKQAGSTGLRGGSHRTSRCRCSQFICSKKFI